MPKQTFDVCYRLQLPCYFHSDIEADSPEEAVELAKARFDDQWAGGRVDAHVEFKDYDSASIAYIDDTDGNQVHGDTTIFDSMQNDAMRDILRQLAQCVREFEMIDHGDGPEPYEEQDDGDIIAFYTLIAKARALTGVRPVGFVEVDEGKSNAPKV